MNIIAISIRTRKLPWRTGIFESRQRGQSWSVINRGVEGIGSRRWKSTSRDHREWQSLDVRCGSSGTITVDICNSQELINPLTPLIIYLPPTGVHLRHAHPPLPSFLSDIPFPYALAQINYRWNVSSPTSSSPDIERRSSPLTPRPFSLGSNDYPFPVAIHDTLFAYDFITTNYIPSIVPPPSSTTRKRTVQRPLIVAGSFLGGTVATSFALTTSYASTTKSFEIVGLVTHNAVLDWTSVAVSNDPEERDPGIEIDTTTAWETKTLHQIKKSLFTSPQSAFDNFASPILFFRTSGFVVPPKWAGEPQDSDEKNRYSTSVEDAPSDASAGELELEATAAAPTQQIEEAELGVETARISYLKFPPTVTQASSSSFSRYTDSGASSSQEQLKIPRSLFLYSSSAPSSSTSPTTAAENSHSTNTTKRTDKAKTKKKTTRQEELVTPETQAKEMAKLMRRSVLLYECKDRTMWDEGFDAHGVAEERAGALGLDGDGRGDSVEGDGGEEGGEGRDVDQRVREWMEDCLG